MEVDTPYNWTSASIGLLPLDKPVNQSEASALNRVIVTPTQALDTTVNKRYTSMCLSYSNY